MVEHHNLERAVRQLQQRDVSLRRLRLGLDVVLGGLLTALLATLGLGLLAWSVPRLLVYGAITVLAMVVFTVLQRRVRVAPLDLLIQADRLLGLQASLSTAYEYLRSHATHRFTPSLVAVAETLAPRVEARRVLPCRLPRRAWGVPLLLAATLGAATLKIPPLLLDEARESEVAHEVVRAGQRLEKWGHALEELAKREQLDRSMVLARQMQQLGQRLQREGGEKTQAVERITTLSQYLQRLRQELQERALLSDAGFMVAREIMAAGKSVKQELQEILHLLQSEAQPREMAAVAEQSVLRLSRQLGPNAQLENLLQNLRAGDLEAARQLLRDVLQQQQAAEEVEHLDRARRALEYSSRSIQRGTQGDTAASRARSSANSTGQGPMDMGEAGEFADPMDDMEDYPLSGAEQGYGSSTLTRQHPNPTLRESDEPISNVEVLSGEGAMRLSYIRHLPLQNEAQVPIEQVVVQYQHAAEEVLMQEHIPRPYREHIKQYFLSLGMMK